MKKIIALAIASAFIAPAVMADVTIYGFLDTAVEYSKNKDSATSGDISRMRLVDENSRLGFKGTDKLDSGITLLWNTETRVRVGARGLDGSTDQAAAGWGNRNTFIGLQGDFGLIRAGSRINDVIDQFLGDAASATSDVVDGNGGLDNFVRRGAVRPTSMVIYHSPKFGGAQFKADYDFGGKSGAVNARAYAATAFYNADMFDFGASFKRADDSNQPVTNDKTDGTGIAGISTNANGNEYTSYAFVAQVKPMDGVSIGGGWQRVKTKTVSTAVDAHQDGFGVAAKYKTGKFGYQIAAGKLANVNGTAITSDTGSSEVNGTVVYALSKQSQLQFGLNYLKAEKNAGTYATSGFGLIATDSGVKPAAGGKAVAASIGLRTDF